MLGVGVYICKLQCYIEAIIILYAIEGLYVCNFVFRFLNFVAASDKSLCAQFGKVHIMLYIIFMFIHAHKHDVHLNSITNISCPNSTVLW